MGRFGDDLRAADTWAYVLEALVAADAALRTKVATCWAWPVLALTLRMVAWIPSSFLAIASWIRSSGDGGRETACGAGIAAQHI